MRLFSAAWVKVRDSFGFQEFLRLGDIPLFKISTPFLSQYLKNMHCNSLWGYTFLLNRNSSPPCKTNQLFTVHIHLHLSLPFLHLVHIWVKSKKGEKAWLQAGRTRGLGQLRTSNLTPKGCLCRSRSNLSFRLLLKFSVARVYSESL